jgi:hypothetical protein
MDNFEAATSRPRNRIGDPACISSVDHALQSRKHEVQDSSGIAFNDNPSTAHLVGNRSGCSATAEYVDD